MDRLHKIIYAHYKKATEQHNEYIKYCINENNIHEWYIKISSLVGDDNEFEHGEYIGKITITDDFPYKPPSFMLLTPNGVYDIDGRVCISIGEFHSQNYMPTLGVSGFTNQLISGMIGWRTLGEGIRLLNTTVEEKKLLASESVKYNEQHHNKINHDIEQEYTRYSTKWNK